MRTAVKWFSRGAEFVAAMMMAAMFLTFILQIHSLYRPVRMARPRPGSAARTDRYGWTLEFCLRFGSGSSSGATAFVVRERDHVTFDIIYGACQPKGPHVVCDHRKPGGLRAHCCGRWNRDLGPNFTILRLKKTATLNGLFGDWIRMRDIYSIYILFLSSLRLRYAWRALDAWRHGADADLTTTMTSRRRLAEADDARIRSLPAVACSSSPASACRSPIRS
jgi:C4-dicarboxylate transporter DctQ subunit